MIRVGLGYDIHAFELNRPLYLGGIKIEHTHGLKGHSDGDCLLHAITDALLGAAALGDIGEHFSDQDPKNKNIDSKVILKAVNNLIIQNGYQIINLDVNIISQKPKIAPIKSQILTSIANVLEISPEQINIKAKTKENLDAVGRGEALECQAIVLLEKKNDHT